MSLQGVRIGELDRRLAFENITVAINQIGNARKESFTDAFTVYGKFLTKPGAERFESNEQLGSQNVEVLIRYSVTNMPNERMRFKDLRHGQYYYVKNIQKNPREGYCVIQGEWNDNSIL